MALKQANRGTCPPWKRAQAHEAGGPGSCAPDPGVQTFHAGPNAQAASPATHRAAASCFSSVQCSTNCARRCWISSFPMVLSSDSFFPVSRTPWKMRMIRRTVITSYFWKLSGKGLSIKFRTSPSWSVMKGHQHCKISLCTWAH